MNVENDKLSSNKAHSTYKQKYLAARLMGWGCLLSIESNKAYAHKLLVDISKFSCPLQQTLQKKKKKLKRFKKK